MAEGAKIARSFADTVRMARRRAQPRKTLLTRITTVCDGEEGYPVVQWGLLEDRSLSGVGISVPGAIPVGTKVTIRGRRRELAGIVRYCRLQGAKYLVGVKLDQEDATWDRFGSGL
jgi:hypothetical protein